MRIKAPGKHFRNGLSLADLFKMFPDDAAAERWFIKVRWPEGPRCPRCESDSIAERTKPQPYRCRKCLKDFSVKTDTLMHSSKLGYQIWAIAIYQMATNLKGVSSMRLRHDLDISQKSAWHLAHRIRETFADKKGMRFSGPVEVDEAYFGGLEKNKHGSKKLHAGRGPVGKSAVVGVKDRDSNAVTATVVSSTDARTLQGLVCVQVNDETEIYTDDHRSYIGLPNHKSVNHSVGEYVDGQAHTNGIESFWAMLKRGYHGTYHKMSAKHLQRYVDEFAGRHNMRCADTLMQMAEIAQYMEGRRVPYRDLTSQPIGTIPPALQGGSDVF